MAVNRIIDTGTWEYALRRHFYDPNWAGLHFMAVDKGKDWARQNMAAQLKCGCLFEDVFGEPYSDKGGE